MLNIKAYNYKPLHIKVTYVVSIISPIRTIPSVQELHLINAQNCDDALADYTAGEEFHLALKQITYLR